MRTSRQDYKDSNYETALIAGCDSFQLKYDGWFCRIEIEGTYARVYSRANRELPDFNFEITNPMSATLVGELMHGTNWAQQENLKGKIFLFDVWHKDGLDLEDQPYRTRYSLLKAIIPMLPPHFQRIPNFPIGEFPKMWEMFVKTGDFEGVVFRNKQAQVGAPLLRQKNVIEAIYTVLGTNQGEGKYATTLGALLIGDQEGKPLFDTGGNHASVGGGFDDAERNRIWASRDTFHGKKFKAEGRYLFKETGLLRHPNFVEWID